MTYNPTTIANYFITTYATSHHPFHSDQIFGLTYYAYGWYLAVTDCKSTLIKEPLVCMTMGAVFDSLFDNVVDARTDYYYKKLPNPQGNQAISKEDQKFLDRVWNTYVGYRGDLCDLAFFTEDNPWRRAIIAGRSIIPMFDVYKHFKAKFDKAKQDETPTKTDVV